MAGSKKKKLKKVLPTQPVAPSPTVDQEDDGLVNDLLAQLDSRAPDARSESTIADDEVHITQPEPDHTAANEKQGAKTRFKARQVRSLPCRTQRPLKYYSVGPESSRHRPNPSTRRSGYAGEAGKGGKG